MTHYRVVYYCNDDLGTEYHQTMIATNGEPTGAAEHVFEVLPRMPADIVGVVVVPTYLH